MQIITRAGRTGRQSMIVCRRHRDWSTHRFPAYIFFPAKHFHDTFSEPWKSQRRSITSIAAIKNDEADHCCIGGQIITRERSKEAFLISAITGVAHNRIAFEMNSTRQLRREKGHSNSIGSKLNDPLIAPIYPISQARSHKYLAYTH